LAETLEVLKLLWSGERVDYDGRFRRLNGAQQLPVPTRRIPIGNAGSSSSAIRRTAPCRLRRDDRPGRRISRTRSRASA